MGDQIVGVLWSSSGIIIGSCCDGGLWLGHIKSVPFSIIPAHLEAGKIIIVCFNHNPCRCGTIGELVLVLGYAVLLHVLVIPIIMLFICFIILWILFLSVVETLFIVSGV